MRRGSRAWRRGCRSLCTKSRWGKRRETAVVSLSFRPSKTCQVTLTGLLRLLAVSAAFLSSVLDPP